MGKNSPCLPEKQGKKVSLICLGRENLLNVKWHWHGRNSNGVGIQGPRSTIPDSLRHSGRVGDPMPVLGGLWFYLLGLSAELPWGSEGEMDVRVFCRLQSTCESRDPYQEHQTETYKAWHMNWQAHKSKFTVNSFVPQGEENHIKFP